MKSRPSSERTVATQGPPSESRNSLISYSLRFSLLEIDQRNRRNGVWWGHPKLSVVSQKCLGHSSTDTSGRDPRAFSARVPPWLLLEIAVLFLVVAPCRIQRLGTLGGSRTSGTPHLVKRQDSKKGCPGCPYRPARRSGSAAARPRLAPRSLNPLEPHPLEPHPHPRPGRA